MLPAARNRVLAPDLEPEIGGERFIDVAVVEDEDILFRRQSFPLARLRLPAAQDL